MQIPEPTYQRETDFSTISKMIIKLEDLAVEGKADTKHLDYFQKKLDEYAEIYQYDEGSGYERSKLYELQSILLSMYGKTDQSNECIEQAYTLMIPGQVFVGNSGRNWLQDRQLAISTSIERDNVDIAREYFFADWPVSIRWILFIPSGVLGGLLVSALVIIVNDISPYSIEGWWARVLQSFIFGLAVVYFAAAMAPKYQFAIGISFLLMLLIFLGGTWGFSLDRGLFGNTTSIAYFALHDLICAAGGITALVTIKQKLDNK